LKNPEAEQPKRAETRRWHIVPRCCTAFCQLSADICHGYGSGNFRTFLPPNNTPASGKPPLWQLKLVVINISGIKSFFREMNHLSTYAAEWAIA
jgi:hypothetical protein